MNSYELQVTSYELREADTPIANRRERKGGDVRKRKENPHISIPITHISLLTILLCCLSIFANAQSVSYLYDASGNRLERIINMKMLTPPPQDSTESIIDDEKDIAKYGQDVVQNTESGDENEKTQEIYTDVLGKTQISIYPNPTRGLLTIKISNLPEHSASSLTLFDMQGKVITQKQQLSDENKLDISTQPVGVYIMQITIEDEVTNWKIVKQ
jgi:hypothetical protein